ncbi:hypothetical protein [Thiothrix lacustris]|uniref:hypothetical protein n=1 Tax=Thiothrix lacustris TaxID=525917 RepID=UPI000490CDFA|nr:hypothetical protein [Thiothrix lacustris]
MSHPNTNTKALLNLPPHLFDLVDDASFFERLALTAANIQRRKQAANPGNHYEFASNQWNRWIDQGETA